MSTESTAAARTQPRGAGGSVAANGIRLHYLRYGDGGPQVVVIPGITSPAITWEFVAEPLADGATVHVLDVRGRGLSDKPATGYALTDYAADTAGFLDALGLEAPVVVGHSMGARIAAAFGAAHPGRAASLAIVDPPLTGPGRDPYPTPLATFLDSLNEAQRGATADDMRRYFPAWTDEQLRLRAEWLATCDEGAVVETYENFDREDFFASWRQLAPPLLFVYGAESPVVSPAGLAEVVAANPAAEIAAVPGAGHMIPWDNLDGFLDVVGRFVHATGRRER
jgi:N-formylmaleamate deformylase